jgi:AcrR family transcriptional regulator
MSRREVIEEHLLDVAAQCFASTGYRQTTLEEIARHAGVAKASMYRYFENKQELLAKIFIKVATTFARVCSRTRCSVSTRGKLRRTVQDLYALSEKMGRSLPSSIVKIGLAATIAAA